MVRASSVLATRKVHEIMTKDVVTIDKDERLERVLQLMEKRNISKIPVTEDDLYVGIVTDGEVADELGAIRNIGRPASALHATAALRKDAPTITPEAEFPRLLEIAKREDVGIVPVLHDKEIVGIVTKADLLPFVTDDRPLRDIMITRLHAVSPTDRVIHARRIMLDHRVERLPVLDRGNLVGIVGDFDVALGFAAFKQRISENHQAAQIKNFVVDEIMRRNVVHGKPDMTIREAARLMHDRHVGGLPITLDGTDRIAGMVTRTDLLRTIQI